MSRYLNVADGQLASSSTSLFTAPSEGAVVQITLTNTGATSQTILLKITRPGSTARRIVRIVLEKDESHYIVGLPLSPSDVLSGETSSAGAVDYVVGLGTGPFSMLTRDANGSPKASAALKVTLPEDNNLTPGEIEIVGLLEDIRDVLMKIA